MILALQTGWTERTLARLSLSFRAACHWAIYVRAIAGPDGFPSVEMPRNAPPDARLRVGKARVAIAQLRAAIYPEGDE